MGTRCNICVTDNTGNELWFYRHYDGYPQEVIPSLTPLMERLIDGTVRTNVGQFSGWLIVLGHEQRTPSSHYGNGNVEHDWKVGHYEPTTCMHGDVAYLYTINLDNKTLLVSCVSWDMPDEDIDFIEHTKTEIYRRNRDTGIPEDELVEYNWLDYDTYSKVFTNFIQSSTSKVITNFIQSSTRGDDE